MKLKFRFLTFILIVMLLYTNIPLPVNAEEGKPVLKVAMSEDESIIVERILYTALKKIGYQMTVKTAGMRTMVNDVNYGDSAIVPAQALGLDEEYPNLVRVPVPISYVEVNAYGRTADNFEFTAWGDLAGLRLSHCWKNLFVARNVSRANAFEVVVLNEYEDLWESLLKGETDVSVVPNLTGYVRIVPEGVTMAGVIDRQPRYTYVNKEYDYLVPLISEAYQGMIDDGTMEQIRNSTQKDSKKTILHISSYSTLVDWEIGEAAAIRESLDLSRHDIEYYNFNLNSHLTGNKNDIKTIVANSIRSNFIECNPDLIIVTDNMALEFTLNNYYMLFPKVPVVFCGINDFDPAMLHGFEEYVTGVTEVTSVDKTVTEMLRLYPDTQRIYILNDYTGSSSYFKQSIKNAFEAGGFDVETEFNENKPFPEVLDYIKTFDSNTLVLLGTYFTDGNNSFYSERETQQLVSESSSMPVFALASSFIGKGTLGGMVSVNDNQGQTAGAIAREILDGKPLSEISIITDSEYLNRWQFDYAVADEFGINTDKLPAGHIALNREIPIWESNPFEFRIALFGCALFILIIIGLTAFLRIMRNKNLHLIELQSHLHSAEELIAKDNDIRKMIESLPLSVLIVDTGSCRPEYSNRVFLESNGFKSYEEAEQFDMSSLVGKAYELLKDKKTTSFQYGNIRNPESDIYQRITAEELIFRNKKCYLLVFEDITAQLKEKELLAYAAEKEREASRAKSNFLSNMSHEIRTPLTAITGMTLIGKSSPSLEKKDYAFGKIEDASAHLLGVINDILDMSKIEANKFELSFVEFRFENLLQKVANVFSFRIDEKHLRFSVFLDKNIPMTLIGDDNRIIQVISNLLSNAVKFTPEGGSIRLDTHLVEEVNGICTIRIEVSDTGIGINKNRQAGIFNSFEQAENDTTRKYGGTGLGLSISKHITEMMEGKIWVESEVGKGSKFIFTIKIKRGSSDERVDLSRSLDRENLKLLVIDDEKELRQYFRSIAESLGIPCDTAASGKKALESMKNNDYNIYFVDWNMPEMNGIELAREIRNSTSGNAVIIMISSFEWSLIEDEATNAGVDKFLPKPLFPSAIADCITECLGYQNVLEHAEKTIETMSFEGKRILLVEDMDINREVIISLFEPTKIEFDCAENGKEAVQIFNEKHDSYDMILMDLQMPIMGGLEATRLIRKFSYPKARSIPIIAMTANVFKEDIEQCMNAGMNDHISKPLDFDEAFEKIKSWL